MLVATEQPQLPVQQARAGDSEAWEVLLARYRLPLYAYIFKLVHHEQASLDIVQESYISAARNIHGLREDEKFGSWLFRIAHQKCLQYWRKQHPKEIILDPLDEVMPGPEADPQELLIRKEQEEAFMQYLNQMAVPHRAVLLLHFMEDFSLEEIGRITNTPVGTVKSRLHYARQSLKKLLEKSEI